MSQVDIKERATPRAQTDIAAANTVLRLIVVGILASVARAGWAQDPGEKTPAQSVAEESATEYLLDIPRLPLELALKEFCRQTGLLYGQLPASPSESSFTTRTRVHGKLTADKALAKLLEGSGLTFEWMASNQFTVQARVVPKIPKNGVGVDTTQRSASDQMHARARTRPAADEVDARNRSGSAAQGPEEEVTVTGTRLRSRPGVGGGDGPIPVMVLDREEIDRSGASNVGDLLKYLPQQPYTRAESFMPFGAQFAELRGLGFDTTAIQINGRRLAPSASNLSANAFDLNTIPLVAVKRIEVLPDSASAVYGADAIGGVVNIILYDEVPEPVLGLNYGQARGGAEEQRASLSLGYSTDRLKSTLVLDYFDRSLLLGAERDRWRNQDFRRFGSSDQRSRYTNPGNIYGILPGPLPGLSSRFAAVPIGSTGLGLTSADFVATQGTENRESLNSYMTIVPESDRHSAVGTVELKLQPGLKAVGEFMYVDSRRVYQTTPPTLEQAIVPATNPFNPFHVPVAATFSLPDVGPSRSTIESDLFRGIVGLQGWLGSMAWDISVLRIEDDVTAVTTNTLDPARVASALASINPVTALNVFQDGPGGSPELIESLRAPPPQSKYSSGSTQASGYLSGPLFSLPTGSVDVVIGGELRRESVLFDETRSTLGEVVSNHRVISAVFAEAKVPLINPDAGIPLAQDLTLTAAGRLDDYADFGDTFNPRYGFIWHPVGQFGVRASYGSSFRPPSMLELFTPNVTLRGFIPDPARGNQLYLVQSKVGGNVALKPVKAHSLTAGLIFKPATANDLEVTATYWQIRMRDRITVVHPYLLVLNEGLFPGRVIRNEPTPADVAAGLPGTLVFLDSTRTNFGHLQTSGVDIAASLALETGYGRYTPSVKATWIRDFTTADVPSAPPVERVGVANVFGTIAKWRVVASVGWEYGGLTLFSAARYVPRYRDTTLAFGSPNGRMVPSQTLVDAQASFDLARLLGPGLAGLTLTAGADNLFDKEPNFSEVAGPIGFDHSQGDLKQRYWYIALSKKFQP